MDDSDVLYLGAYIITGVVVLLVELKGSNPRDDLRGEHAIAMAMIMVVSAVIFVAAWPVVLAFEAVQFFRKRASAKPPVFVVRKADLREQVPVEEIERRETVVDPLNAAPQLPFGHFNAKWLTFRQNLRPRHVLWSFQASWASLPRGTEILEGYVAVRGRSIGPYFLVTRRTTRSS